MSINEDNSFLEKFHIRNNKDSLVSKFNKNKIYFQNSNIEKNTITNSETIENVEKIRSYFVKAYIDSIKNEDLEFGITGHTTELVKNFLAFNKGLILTELQNLVLKNFKDKRLVYSALHTFAHLEYDLVYPQGPIFALAMSRHKDIVIQDFSIQCFEMWCNKSSLDYLEQVSIDSIWLSEYLQKTIEYIQDS